MNELGIGVVGCGFVGYGAHIPSFREIAGARLVAVADHDERRRGKAVAKHHIDTAYDDYRELVQDPRVDAVVISLPTPLHMPAAMAAIEAEKHLLCEMPLASNLEDADRLIEAAERAHVVLMPGLTFRFASHYVRVKQMIREGVIGRPTSVLYREFIPASALASQWPADSWMWQVETSGGPLYTLSVWSIDLIRWLFDTEITAIEPVVRYSKLVKSSGTIGYDAYGVLRLANGMVGCLQYSGSVNRAAAKSALEIVGDSTSMIRVEDNDQVTLFGDTPAITTWDLKESGARMWGHQQQNEHFVRSILAGQTPNVTPQDGRKAMEIALKIAAGSAG